ncbi:hypothetical protein TURU_107671 [Turdus rufiventris]|nr:hypothetical protein TURU_107671 [Turdus rufiventris]
MLKIHIWLSRHCVQPVFTILICQLQCAAIGTCGVAALSSAGKVQDPQFILSLWIKIHTYRRRQDTVNKDTEPKDPFPIPRKIMAEPDYIDDDNPELIRPQKLINPVKSSRNHQDLHRELLMNQKRGLAPQNKPELQKVMEKRKRDQVIKQQKEEEAQKKKSDLEIELLKRQQKLEQLELEKQKIQEEQENAPEFVKVKGNLRRTVQEATEAPDS